MDTFSTKTTPDPSTPTPPADQSAARARWAELTPAQARVVKLIALGRSRNEIAAELRIAVKTVDMHRLYAARATGARHSVDLTRLAIAAGEVAA